MARRLLQGLYDNATSVVVSAAVLTVGTIIHLDHATAPSSLHRELLAYTNKNGAAAFRDCSLIESDVILLSYPKCGTSFGHSIVWQLLRMEADGTSCSEEIGGKGQVHHFAFESLFFSDGISTESSENQYSFHDLVSQRSPRLFTSHAKAIDLPLSLKTNGRIVVFSRDPKDCLISGYHYIHTVVDPKPIPRLREWYTGGLEAYFLHFLPVDTQVQGYGDWWQWHRDLCHFTSTVEESRVLFCFYEHFLLDFDHEAQRLADFLEIDLTPIKLQSLRTFSHFDNHANVLQVDTRRRGVIGDHRQYLTSQHWLKLDCLFDLHLGFDAATGPMSPLHPTRVFDAALLSSSPSSTIKRQLQQAEKP